MQPMIIDSFVGGGGASMGIEMAPSQSDAECASTQLWCRFGRWSAKLDQACDEFHEGCAQLLRAVALYHVPRSIAAEQALKGQCELETQAVLHAELELLHAIYLMIVQTQRPIYDAEMVAQMLQIWRLIGQNPLEGNHVRSQHTGSKQCSVLACSALFGSFSAVLSIQVENAETGRYCSCPSAQGANPVAEAGGRSAFAPIGFYKCEIKQPYRREGAKETGGYQGGETGFRVPDHYQTDSTHPRRMARGER